MPPKVVRIDSLLKQTKSTASSITKTRSKGKAAVKQTLADQLAALPHSASPKPIIKQENQQGQEGQSLQTAMDHLCSVDPRFRILFQRFTPQPWTETGLAERKDHFKSLVLSVLSQQVSGAAARAIGRRFIGLFTDVSNAAKVEVDMDPEVEDGPPRLSAITSIKVEQETSSLANSAPANEDLEGSFFPSPEQVAASDVLYIKSAGASLRKAEYVHGIANSFVSGELTDEFFNTADDESIKKKLISIRGLGPWSAEMFMVYTLRLTTGLSLLEQMFSLKRWDIVSPGDIGIQRVCQPYAICGTPHADGARECLGGQGRTRWTNQNTTKTKQANIFLKQKCLTRARPGGRTGESAKGGSTACACSAQSRNID